jgi:hypothetical protein
MAAWDDASRVCAALDEATESTTREGHRQWRVRDETFVWQRPLRRDDLAELGEAAPTGPVLGARVPDESAKQALISDDPDTCFTTQHFEGYPAVLCRLQLLTEEGLAELAARPGPAGRRGGWWPRPSARPEPDGGRAACRSQNPSDRGSSHYVGAIR